MSNRAKRSGKKKKPLDQFIVVRRSEFRTAFNLLSHAMQAMGEEFEMFRSDKDIPKDVKRTAMQIIGTHLQNVQHLSVAFQLSIFDPIDPDGTKGRDLN